MDQKILRDEEALSTEEINRVKTNRLRVLKKIATILLTIGFIFSMGYLISLVNWKKRIHDYQKMKMAKMIIVDKNLSPKFVDEEF
jgi:cytochrome bd-type quinol oxidase subunit 1